MLAPSNDNHPFDGWLLFCAYCACFYFVYIDQILGNKFGRSKINIILYKKYRAGLLFYNMKCIIIFDNKEEYLWHS